MLVVAQKKLVAYGAVRRNQIVARPRHPVHHLVVFGDVGIEDPKCADYFAADIGEKRILDLVGLTEVMQNLRRVVGYRCSINALASKLFQRNLQLDELITAVGSPIRAAAEYQ